MALQFSNQIPNNDNVVDVEIIGDGTSTSINIDLTLPPFNYNYKGNRPTSITTPNISSTLGVGSVVLNPDKVSFTLSFVTAPSAGAQGQVSFSLLFEGV